MALVHQTASLPGDLDPILDSMLPTFYDPAISAYAECLWGPISDPNTRVRAKKFLSDDLSEDPTLRWMVVVDEEKGSEPRNIVSALQWKIYPNFTKALVKPWNVNADYLEGSEKEQAEHVLKELSGHVHDAIRSFGGGEAHIRLNILYTHPSYQRRGVASKLIKWGCELADHMALPMWVEASSQGRSVYEANGFVDVNRSFVKTEKWEVEQFLMRRPIKNPIREPFR